MSDTTIPDVIDEPIASDVVYIVQHNMVGDKLKGEVFVPPVGCDIDRLLSLGAISLRNAPEPEL